MPLRRLNNTNEEGTLIQLTLDWSSSKRLDKFADETTDKTENRKLAEDAVVLDPACHALQDLKVSHFPRSSLPLTISVNDDKKLSHLKTLSFSNCPNLIQLPASIGSLESLHSLSISSCNSLEGLPSEVGQLASLQKLTLEFCSAFEFFPSEIGKGCRRLEYLALTNLANWKNGVPSADDSCFASLKILIMNSCPLMESIPQQGMLHLEALHLKKSIRNISSLERWRNLRSIKLAMCPDLQTMVLSDQNSNLATVEVSHCESLQTVQIVHSKKEEGETEEEHSLLPKLKCVVIATCPRLECLPVEFGSLPGLETLKLLQCPSLADFHLGGSLSTSSSSALPSAPPTLKELCLESLPNQAMLRLLETTTWTTSNLANLSLANCQLTDKDYPQILGALPSCLVKLNLGANNIHSLEGFMSTDLPPGLQYLNLKQNPVFSDYISQTEVLRQQQGFCEQLLLQNPCLRFLGNEDYRVGENDVVTTYASFLLLWNGSGRILVSGQAATKPIPLSVWPTVLGRVQEVVAFADDFDIFEASIMYLLLHGPVLLTGKD